MVLANAVVITLYCQYPCYDKVNMSGCGCLCSDDAATLSNTGLIDLHDMDD